MRQKRVTKSDFGRDSWGQKRVTRGGLEQPDKKTGNKGGSKVGFELKITILQPARRAVVTTHPRELHIRALYEKEGSKNARHNNVDFSTNICALSYIDVQVFDIWSGNLFRGTHERLPMAFKFAKLQPRFFLYFDMPWGQKRVTNAPLAEPGAKSGNERGSEGIFFAGNEGGFRDQAFWWIVGGPFPARINNRFPSRRKRKLDRQK
ncbi:hypothetical protein K438DRAFT_2165707 [Mycena galopus ATCC 62051]|nr:hypothetical protein K438DRAFT_2165707 [Mycena galopus ATCC 62051]